MQSVIGEVTQGNPHEFSEGHAYMYSKSTVDHVTATKKYPGKVDNRKMIKTSGPKLRLTKLNCGLAVHVRMMVNCHGELYPGDIYILRQTREKNSKVFYNSIP